jgi:hypothetical protein
MVDMTTSNKEHRGLPWFQWASLMVTIVTLIGGIFLYITNIEKRVCLMEKDNQQKTQQMYDMQKTLTEGMTLRIQLQSDVRNMMRQLDRIEKMVENHIEKDKLAVLGNKSLDNIP